MPEQIGNVINGANNSKHINVNGRNNGPSKSVPNVSVLSDDGI